MHHFKFPCATLNNPILEEEVRNSNLSKLGPTATSIPPKKVTARTVCQSYHFECKCEWRILLLRKSILGTQTAGLSNEVEVVFNAIRTWFVEEKNKQWDGWEEKDGKTFIQLIEQVSESELQLEHRSNEFYFIIVQIVESSTSSTPLENKENKPSSGSPPRATDTPAISSVDIPLCLNWIRQISRHVGVIPNSLILEGVKKTDPFIINSGGLTDKHPSQLLANTSPTTSHHYSEQTRTNRICLAKAMSVTVREG